MRKVSRRDVIKISGAAGAASLLAACLPATPTSSSASATAASQAPQTAGKYKLGKLEGAEVITDASKFPKSFKEAPELATLVQQGKLPKVADRIGQDPIVLRPVHEIGKYGGTMHKALFGTVGAEQTAYKFAVGPSSLFFWDTARANVVPNIAKSYEHSADGKTLTVHLRRGMRWSDGEPFTADDIVFWWQDIYQNKDLVTPSPDLTVSGKPVTIEKVDDYTVRYNSPDTNRLLIQRLASPATDIGGPTFRVPLGGYAPKHYLQKFLPKYAAGGQAALDKQAADAKLNGWALYFLDRVTWQSNPDYPLLGPWIVTVPMNNPSQFVMQRNPYSAYVDTDGNQLPYIGTLQYTNVATIDVATVNATNGDYDFQEVIFGVDKLPVLIDGQQRGKYQVSLDPEQAGFGIALNLAYTEDAEIGDWLRNVDFRRALSMGVDRNEINEVFFLGTGTPSSSAPTDDNVYFPGKEWRTKWSTLDVAQANQLLDKIGLTQKDGDGYRLRKDGKGRLSLTFTGVVRLGIDGGQFAELVKRHWQKIGIDVIVDVIASSLAQQRLAANQMQMVVNSESTEDVYLFTGTLTPVTNGYTRIMGLPYAQWVNTGGQQGKEPFPALKAQIDLFEKGKTQTDADRIETGKELFRQAIDNVFNIGIIVGDLNSGIRIAKTNVGNVPERMVNSNAELSPINVYAQTLYFK